MYDRLATECLHQCDALSLHTETPGSITRRFLTPPMVTVHRDVGDWMRAAGMSVDVDDAGNITGRRSSRRPNAKRLIIGSHLDTIPNGGKYDGILGVMVGIAVVRAVADVELPFDIDVIGFSEEEGVRFSLPYIGSRAIAGSFDASWLSLRDNAGVTLSSAIESFGLTPGKIADAAVDPDRVLGFVETHIEQGPVLAGKKLSVAAVNAIAGQTRMRLLFVGDAGHAGTVPMAGRSDPLVVASRWIAEVSDRASRVDDLRATVGCVRCLPGARNVIPGSVEVSLDVRHGDDAVRKSAVDELIGRAGELSQSAGVTFQILEAQSQPAAIMDASLTDAIRRAMTASRQPDFSMLSGAGHDAVVMADRFPTAMLFIRQPKGISHHPGEDVEAVDIAVAIEVLTNFVIQQGKL